MQPRTAALFPAVRPAVVRGNRPVCTVIVDTEEAFDWERPVPGVPYSTACLGEIGTLHRLLQGCGATPTYLLTYPALQDEVAMQALRSALARHHGALGVQMHPWVTPPSDAGALTVSASYAGNLDPVMEEAKLLALVRRFTDVFGDAPRIYKAGRYGLSQWTADLLEAHGFAVDTSLAPRTTYVAEGGPDYTRQGCGPFWFGRRRRLLELPLCRAIIGWGGGPGRHLYRLAASSSLAPFRLPALLARVRCAERVTLSPEGNDARSARRLLRSLNAAGQGVYIISLHSSSLLPGGNPYVRTRADLHRLYDWLADTLDFLAHGLNARFAGADELPSLLLPA